MSSISAELEVGSSIFIEDADGLELNDSLAAEIEESSVPMDERFDSFTMDDDKIEKMENDMEKVQSLLSLLQSSAIADGSLEEDFDKMGLILNEDFVIMVLETPYIPMQYAIYSEALQKSDDSKARHSQQSVPFPRLHTPASVPPVHCCSSAKTHTSGVSFSTPIAKDNTVKNLPLLLASVSNSSFS
ncbi:unnamed protein product [Fraxinus pennsylvanica]|uniref:Uncharacterized protein n=1 Tax=Fraxinus pennsylvanica TaxID=56036 RepID=A0AAD1ZWN3_9LAMI|nr:unnamed protein product [Fraxinus pennsylvanica]